MSMGTCNVCGIYCNMLSNGYCHECRRVKHFNKPKAEVVEIVRELPPVFIDRLHHWLDQAYAYNMGDQKVCGLLTELRVNIEDWELGK